MKDVKELVEKLETGINKMFNSENYKNWLRTVSKFHHYSLNNIILIAIQMPTATKVAGYKAWQKMGRNVRKGEKAIKIMAPMKCKKTELNRDGEEVERVWMSYRPAAVFDYSQTDGEDLPEICNALDSDEDYNGLFDTLVGVCEVPVEVKTLNGENGHYNYVTKSIAIEESISGIQKVKTLLHEMAHMEFGHGKDGKTREQKEVEAESVAYIVSQYLGIDSSDYSFGYIAGWSGNDREVAVKYLDGIQTTAGKIIELLENTNVIAA